MVPRWDRSLGTQAGDMVGAESTGAAGEAVSEPSGMCFETSSERVAAGSSGEAEAGASCSLAGSFPHFSGLAVDGDVSGPPISPLDTRDEPIAFSPLYTVAQGEGEKPAPLAQPWHCSSVSKLPAPGMLGGTRSGAQMGRQEDGQADARSLWPAGPTWPSHHQRAGSTGAAGGE